MSVYNTRMNEPRCIRIFYDRADAYKACAVITDAGFKAYVTEDRFGAFPLPHYGMLERFRLYVDRDDINKVALVLSKKLKK